MTRGLDIMVGTDLSLEALVQDLNRLWHMAAQPASDEFDTWYEYTDEDTYITIGTHEFVNDRDMHFEDYRYHIGFWPRWRDSPDEVERWRQERVPALYDILKEAGRYRLLFVDDVQRKLDEYNPEQESSNQPRPLGDG